MMEEWNGGRMGKNIGLIDLTQYSNIPSFQYSNFSGIWQIK
jgi:hypothetical protein